MKKEVLDFEKMSDEDVDRYYRRGLRGGAITTSTGLGLGLLNEFQGYDYAKQRKLRRASLGIAGTGLGLMGLSSYLHYKDKQRRKGKGKKTKTFTLTPQQTALLQKAGFPQQNQNQNQLQNPVPQQQRTGEVTMKDLQLEQARLQRQQIQIQHQKSQLLLKDEMARRRAVVQLQKLKKDQDDARVKNSIRVKKEENDHNEEAQARNASLYKSRPKLVQPVGMPKGK